MNKLNKSSKKSDPIIKKQLNIPYIKQLAAQIVKAGIGEWGNMQINIQDACPTVVTIRDERSWMTRIFVENEDGLLEPVFVDPSEKTLKEACGIEDSIIEKSDKNDCR